jgi:hypothetical protein
LRLPTEAFVYPLNVDISSGAFKKRLHARGLLRLGTLPRGAMNGCSRLIEVLQHTE